MLEKIFVTQGLDLIRFHDRLQAPKIIKLDRLQLSRSISGNGIPTVVPSNLTHSISLSFQWACLFLNMI